MTGVTAPHSSAPLEAGRIGGRSRRAIEQQGRSNRRCDRRRGLHRPVRRIGIPARWNRFRAPRSTRSCRWPRRGQAKWAWRMDRQRRPVPVRGHAGTDGAGEGAWQDIRKDEFQRRFHHPSAYAGGTGGAHLSRSDGDARTDEQDRAGRPHDRRLNRRCMAPAPKGFEGGEGCLPLDDRGPVVPGAG